MTIKAMEYVPAFHYELQTFCEKRETAWTYSPLRSGEGYGLAAGGGLYGGAPPLPWEIEEYPTQPFKDEVIECSPVYPSIFVSLVYIPFKGEAPACPEHEQRQVLPPLPRHRRDALSGLQRQGLGQVHQLPRRRLAYGHGGSQGKVYR